MTCPTRRTKNRRNSLDMARGWRPDALLGMGKGLRAGLLAASALVGGTLVLVPATRAQDVTFNDTDYAAQGLSGSVFVVNNNLAGNTTVTLTSPVTSSITGTAIDVANNNAFNSGSISVDVAQVAGGGSGVGILVTQAGSGAVVVGGSNGALSDITSGSEAGIRIRQTSTGDSDTVIVSKAGTLTGVNGSGVDIQRVGTGAAGIMVSGVGDITGLSLHGLVIENSGNSGAIEVTRQGLIQGVHNGVLIAQSGSGAVTVGGTGGATGGANASGVYVQQTGTGPHGAVTVSRADTLSGGDYGVLITRSGTGSGAITVSGTGAITGTNNAGLRIENNNAANTGAIQITGIGEVTSTGGHGVIALQTGTGNVTISSNNLISGQTGGIRATVAGSDITIDGSGDTTAATGTA
ncbi:MAG: beta strand repeat-containing protein, partial [Rhodospirillales bacterium]